MTRATAAAIVVLAAALCFGAVPAAAQEPVTSFDLLHTRLEVGDTVWVTDAQGREIGEDPQSLAHIAARSTPAARRRTSRPHASARFACSRRTR